MGDHVSDGQPGLDPHQRFISVPFDDVPMEGNLDMQEQRLVISSGRHIGWWVEGRSKQGRHRFMWTWWPMERLARTVARCWARLARSFGRNVVIDDASPHV